MEQAYITIGAIVNAHGIRGEVKVMPQGIDPKYLTQCGAVWLAGSPVAVSACRVHKGCLLMKLAGVDDMDAALALKGKPLSVRREDVRLPQGVYFDQELIGLTARDAATGAVLGAVEEVMDYPAHKVYAVRGGKDEYLIPAVPAFVKEISLTDKTMDIIVWEGMGSHED